MYMVRHNGQKWYPVFMWRDGLSLVLPGEFEELSDAMDFAEKLNAQADWNQKKAEKKSNVVEMRRPGCQRQSNA